MTVNIHEKYIHRCIEIAKSGLGITAPNPMVGCVIVHKDLIIGEGFTSAYGGNHAEINALNSVQDKSLLKESTLYVTLEPCSHVGKTPPCADAIIAYNIPTIVIGTIDTHSKVSGQGIQKLKDAGREVIVGALEDACKQHHKRFFTFHNKRRPFIILKWAQTSYGFIAPKSKLTQQPVWITNEISRQLVHKWRAEEQAILVGTNTVLEDNPSLTVRDWTGENPIRIVMDRDLKLPKSQNVFNGEAKTIILCDIQNATQDDSTNDNSNLSFEFLDWNLKDAIAAQICKVLYDNNINSVIIEGGRQTLQTFINEGLWDEARVFYGSEKFTEGVKAPTIQGTLISEDKILKDTLKIYVKN